MSDLMSHPGSTEREALLRSKLVEISEGNEDFWSFVGRNKRNHTHSFFQYPAMMVPQMQQVLMEAITTVVPQAHSVFDPFVGSGTVMTEAMLLGLSVNAQDINPLAVLLCRTKSGPMDISLLTDDLENITHNIANDSSSEVEVSFPNIDKWFTKEISQELSKIKRAIRSVSEMWRRRFFWVVLAETVRLASNSRTSNFKLYVMTPESIKNRKISAVDIFIDIAKKNLTKFEEHSKALSARKLLVDKKYTRSVEIILGDSSKLPAPNDVKSDLLITSPPYGDNSTTVSYGQYSYLPLQWVDLADIDDNINESYLSSTHEIDARSLGGSRSKALERATPLLDVSVSFRTTLEDLKALPADRSQRVASFCSDLNNSIDPILSRLKSDAYMVWVVGNRSVGNKQVPLNQILRELLEARGSTHIVELKRTFPSHSKRMANLTNTMPTEHILVMKKSAK